MADQSTLELILQDTAASLVASSNAEKVAVENAQKAENLSSANAELLKGVATNQALVMATKQAADLNAQKATLRAANAAGVDPTAAGDVITSTLTKIVSSNQEINKNLDRMDELAKVSFFDDGPMQWIKSKIETVGLKGEVEREAQKNVVLNQQLDATNQSIQQVAQTQNAIKETITAASAEAATKTAASLALIESNNAAREALKYNTAAVDAAMTASKDRLALHYNARNAQIQEITLNRQLDQLKLSQEEFEWRKQEKKATDAAKAEGKQVDEYVLESINIGRAARGLQPISGAGAKTGLQLFKSGGEGAKELATDYQNGERTRIAGIPILGATPSESLKTLEYATDIPEVRKAVVATLQRAQATALSSGAKVDLKNKAAVEEFINKTARADIAMQYQRVVSGDPNNVFDIGDVRSYLQMKAVKDLPVVTQVLAPAAALNQPLTDTRVIVGLVSSAVKDGRLTSSQATDLATVYQLANSINIAARGLTGFGIIPPQNGKAYNASFGVGKTINMADPVAITRVLSEDLAKRMSSAEVFQERKNKAAAEPGINLLPR